MSQHDQPVPPEFNPDPVTFEPTLPVDPGKQPFPSQQSASGRNQALSAGPPPPPPPIPPYPIFPDNYAVEPTYLNYIINLPAATTPYQINGQWHLGFEGWAYTSGLNGGWVSHFNVSTAGGPMLHVYFNLWGYLEVVGVGGRPSGF